MYPRADTRALSCGKAALEHRAALPRIAARARACPLERTLLFPDGPSMPSQPVPLPGLKVRKRSGAADLDRQRKEKEEKKLLPPIYHIIALRQSRTQSLSMESQQPRMISTRLMKAFGLAVPVMGAPMAGASGAALAAAVARAGGLGFLGSAFSEAAWIQRWLSANF